MQYSIHISVWQGWQGFLRGLHHPVLKEGDRTSSFCALGICALHCPWVAFLCRLMLHHMMGEAAVVNITWADPVRTLLSSDLIQSHHSDITHWSSLQNPVASQKTFERQLGVQWQWNTLWHEHSVTWTYLQPCAKVVCWLWMLKCNFCFIGG